jgi:hypothetical protein
MMAKRPSSKWFGLLPITAVALWVAGCGLATPPNVTDISVEPETKVLLTGETASLTVQANGRNLQFNWVALRGKLSHQTGPAVIYTAPGTSGPDIISVEVTSDGASTVRTITFNIVLPPTATPTFTPAATPTPLSIVTHTPTPTEIPMATPTATRIPTLAPTPTSSYILEFEADKTVVNPGEWITLRWRVENVQAVYLDWKGGAGAAGIGEDIRQMWETTDHTLRVVLQNGETVTRTITITVR